MLQHGNTQLAAQERLGLHSHAGAWER